MEDAALITASRLAAEVVCYVLRRRESLSDWPAEQRSGRGGEDKDEREEEDDLVRGQAHRFGLCLL